MLDSYWLKSSDDTHKERIKAQNAEQISADLDKYWENKDKKQEDKPENPEAQVTAPIKEKPVDEIKD